MEIRIEVITDEGMVFHGETKLVRAEKREPRSARVHETKTGKVKCPEAVRDLWQKGKFKSSSSFATIKDELSQSGFNFPDNTLMMALSSAKYLTRRGSKGSYTWSQRHPYNG
jgi:hypothetical protein